MSDLPQVPYLEWIWCCSSFLFVQEYFWRTPSSRCYECNANRRIELELRLIKVTMTVLSDDLTGLLFHCNFVVSTTDVCLSAGPLYLSKASATMKVEPHRHHGNKAWCTGEPVSVCMMHIHVYLWRFFRNLINMWISLYETDFMAMFVLRWYSMIRESIHVT